MWSFTLKQHTLTPNFFYCDKIHQKLYMHTYFILKGMYKLDIAHKLLHYFVHLYHIHHYNTTMQSYILVSMTSFKKNVHEHVILLILKLKIPGLYFR